MARMIALLLLLSLVSVVVKGNGVSPAEYNALVDFYNALTGPKWENQSHWLSGDPCENSWFGVGCTHSASSPHVLNLDLTKNNLNGSLPSSLSNLFALDSLVLTVNNISSTIPSDFNALRSLTLINLSHNSLSGSIPDDLGDLVDFSLVSLDFSYNLLSGYVPEFFVTDESSFEYVDLSNNNFLCPIPQGAEYTQATCIQVNITKTTTNCFNNPFETTDVLVLGSGFDSVNGIPLLCLFEMNFVVMAVTTAYVESPTQLYCDQPVINFSNCNGLRGGRMVAYGSVSIGTKNNFQYTSVSNSLPINILNNVCTYGHKSEYSTTDINGCPHAVFPVIGDALEACSHGNPFPYRCPRQVQYEPDGNYSLATFDYTCNTTNGDNCMWAPLASDPDSDGLFESDYQYCPYYDPYFGFCTIPYAYEENDFGTYDTSQCLDYSLSSEVCYLNRDKDKENDASKKVKADLVKLASIVDSIELSVEKSAASVVKSIEKGFSSVGKSFSSVKKSLTSDNLGDWEQKMGSIEKSLGLPTHSTEKKTEKRIDSIERSMGWRKEKKGRK